MSDGAAHDPDQDASARQKADGQPVVCRAIEDRYVDGQTEGRGGDQTRDPVTQMPQPLAHAVSIPVSRRPRALCPSAAYQYRRLCARSRGQR
jgi:hypothetical protein